VSFTVYLTAGSNTDTVVNYQVLSAAGDLDPSNVENPTGSVTILAGATSAAVSLHLQTRPLLSAQALSSANVNVRLLTRVIVPAASFSSASARGERYLPFPLAVSSVASAVVSPRTLIRLPLAAASLAAAAATAARLAYGVGR